MAVLFEREVSIFAETIAQKEELDNLALSGHKIVEMIDGSDTGSLNFNNVQKFLHSSGLMPYDSEIIAFLRRVDRDDDGVISGEEMNNFMQLFHQTENVLDTMRKRHSTHVTSQARLKTFSPGRQIVSNKLVMISPQTLKQKVLQEATTGLVNRNIIVESRTVAPSVIEDTIVSKYPSKMESIQTTYSQNLAQPAIEIRENVNTPLQVQSTVVQQVNNMGNPRIRYSQPKILTQSVHNVHDSLEHTPVASIQNTVVEQAQPIAIRTPIANTTTTVTKNYQNYRNVSPAPVVVQQTLPPVSQTTVVAPVNQSSLVGSRVYHNTRSSTSTIVGQQNTVTQTPIVQETTSHHRNFAKPDQLVGSLSQAQIQAPVLETNQSTYQSIQQAAGSMAFTRSQNRVQQFQPSTRLQNAQQAREVSPGLIADQNQ